METPEAPVPLGHRTLLCTREQPPLRNQAGECCDAHTRPRTRGEHTRGCGCQLAVRLKNPISEVDILIGITRQQVATVGTHTVCSSPQPPATRPGVISWNRARSLSP